MVLAAVSFEGDVCGGSAMIRALRLLRPPLLSVPTSSTGATTRFASSFSLLVPCIWIIEERLAWEFSFGAVSGF